MQTPEKSAQKPDLSASEIKLAAIAIAIWDSEDKLER
jgi:hypothetical protein